MTEKTVGLRQRLTGRFSQNYCLSFLKTLLLLALVMVFAMTTVTLAADAASPRLTVCAEIGDGHVSATVYLEGAAGVTNGRITLTYDPKAATLEGTQVLLACGAASVNQEEGEVSLAWVGSELGAEETAAVCLTFTFVGEQDLTLTAEAPEAYAGETTLTVEAGTATVAYTPFTDIDGHWAKSDILKAYHAGLFQGMTDTTFAPQEKLNRAMFVTVLYRMAGEPEVEAKTDFTDVEEGRYYTNAVAWAVKTGVTKGVGENLFAPCKLLDRQEAATMLYRFAKASGRDMSKTADLSQFTDESRISGWAENALSWAVAEGLLKGYPNGQLCPRGNATRAEAAAILVRYAGI